MLDTQAKHDELVAQMPASDHAAWIGGEKVGSKMAWSSNGHRMPLPGQGNPHNYEAWAQGNLMGSNYNEPDNLGSEKCAIVAGGIFQWRTWNCNSKAAGFGYACEFRQGPQPPPATLLRVTRAVVSAESLMLFELSQGTEVVEVRGASMPPDEGVLRGLEQLWIH